MSEDNRELDLDKDYKARGPVARFFISGWNNIVRLMGANALFIIFNIPAIVFSFLLSILFLPVLIPAFTTVTEADGSFVIATDLILLLAVGFITFLLSGLLVCVGPFQAGFAQVYKDMRNGTSFSLFGSFKTGLKAGWKKSIAAMFIGMIISAILLLAVSFYMNMHTTVGTVIGAVFIVLLFAFILVQNFVYQLIVSTDLKLFKIYKNAVLFVLIRFIPCLGAGVIVFLFYYLIPFVLLMSASYLTLGIFIFLYSFLVIAWVQYFLSYFAAGLIDKYVAVDNEAS